MIEDYRVIAGRLYINERPVGRSYTILPGQVHQASTRDIGALAIIRLRYASRFAESEQHVRSEDTVPV